VPPGAPDGRGDPRAERAVVFVVDDDSTLARALCRLVRAAGLDAEAFSSAQAFLDAPPPDRAACLVLDVRMPGLSGPQLQETLRRAGREIPIVFITGHADVATSVRAMKGGAFDFLEKPFQDEVLLDTIERALARDRSARAARAEREAIRERIAKINLQPLNDAIAETAAAIKANAATSVISFGPARRSVE
jgi:FixJ family two-component response regulator